MIDQFFNFSGLIPEALIMMLAGIGFIVLGFVLGYALREIIDKWF
jgi:uncharacterized membrane protein (Fun14 family)